MAHLEFPAVPGELAPDSLASLSRASAPMLVPIVLCGGDGSRLWPLSRALRPKPFLAVPAVREHAPEQPAGAQPSARQDSAVQEKHSDPSACSLSSTLLGQTYARLAAADVELAGVISVGNAEYAFLCGEIFKMCGPQCEHVVLAEPMGRNTAPAVAVAAGFAQARFGPETILLVLPSDHRITGTAAFWKYARQAADAARAGSIVLFGVKPRHPAAGYGYIECGGASAEGETASRRALAPVHRFVEKPDYARAVEYIQRGFYWNSGMFCFAASTMKRELAEHAADVAARSEAVVQKIKLPAAEPAGLAPPVMLDSGIYAGFPSISLDRAVIEKTRRAMAVIAQDLCWSDVGSWNSFAEPVPADKKGNQVCAEAELLDTEGCLVIGGQRLVSLVGMRDTCVVDSADALLICAKDSAERTREIFARLREKGHPAAQTPRRVIRPWGSYTVLATGKGWQLKLIEVTAGACLSLQSHRYRSEHWTTVSGVMTVVLGDRSFDMNEDRSCYVPVGVKHRMMNHTSANAAVIELQIGSYLGEDDIVRYEDVYGRV